MGKHRRKMGRKSASTRKPKRTKGAGAAPVVNLQRDGLSKAARAAKLKELEVRAAKHWAYLLFLRGMSAHPGHVVLVQDGDTIRTFTRVQHGEDPEGASFAVELLEQFIQEAMQRGERVVVADWTFPPEGGRVATFWVFRMAAGQGGDSDKVDADGACGRVADREVRNGGDDDIRP